MKSWRLLSNWLFAGIDTVGLCTGGLCVLLWVGCVLFWLAAATEVCMY